MRYSNLRDQAPSAMQYDLLALHALQPIYSGFIPWSDSALRPAAIQILANELFVNRRKLVLEFGSGVSSLYFAEVLLRQGGRLISIEHDAAWIKEVQSWLGESQRQLVTFVHAPLTAAEFDGKAIEWYDRAMVQAALADISALDVVLVDGPPAYQAPFCLNRAPAVPEVLGKLAPDAIILLDDIDREGEQHIASRWSELLGAPHRALTVEAGVALWRLGMGFNTSQ